MAAQDQLRVTVRHEPDRTVLSLSGELDLASASVFQREFERAGTEASAMVVLDLEDLEFIDSTGLRIILNADEQSRRSGQGFAVTRGSKQVQRLLSMTGINERLRIIGSPDEIPV